MGVRLKLFLALVIGVIHITAAQKRARIDSIHQRLKLHQTGDSIKVDYLNALSKLYYHLDFDSSYHFGYQALKLSQKLAYNYGIAESYKNLGFAHIPWGHYDSSRMYFDSSLFLLKDLPSSYLLSETYVGVGITNEESGRYQQSLQAYYNALAIKSNIGDIAGQGRVHNNLGQLFRNMGELDSATFHLLMALENEAFLRDYSDGAATYFILGMVKLSLEEFETAKKFFRKALSRLDLPDQIIKIASSNAGLGRAYLAQGNVDSAKFFLKLGAKQFASIRHLAGEAHTTASLAEAFRVEDNCDSALIYYKKGIEIREAADNMQYLAREMTSMSRCLVATGKPDDAIKLTLEAAELAKRIGSKSEALGAYSLLHEIYAQKNAYRKAYEMMKLSAAYKDSLLSQQRINEINRLEKQYEISNIKKEQALFQAETEAKELRLKNEISRGRWVLFGTIAGIVALMVIAMTLYFSLKQKRRDNALIAQKNEKIRLINESLEKRVKERTEKVERQNKKLRNYAFSNSHEVRAPLARLMGLVDLWNKENNKAQRDFIIEKISKSALELDDIIRKLNVVLKEEDLEP